MILLFCVKFFLDIYLFYFSVKFYAAQLVQAIAHLHANNIIYRE
jgi:serine/threonine protein kinase